MQSYDLVNEHILEQADTSINTDKRLSFPNESKFKQPIAGIGAPLLENQSLKAYITVQ